MTARELCTSALRYLNVIAENETQNPSDINLVFDALNDLMDSLSTDSYMIYSEVDEEFNLIPSQESYSIGPTGADFTAVRPGTIQRGYVRVDGVSYPLTLLNNQQYNAIGMKALEITWPKYLYYNPTFPNGTIKFWPVPSVANPIVLTWLNRFTRFTNLNTAVSLPVGYSRMLKWNLIAEVAEAFGKDVSASVIKKAATSKATLQRLNSPPVKMRFDGEITGRNVKYSIYTDGSV